MHRTDHSRFRKTHDFVPDFSTRNGGPALYRYYRRDDGRRDRGRVDVALDGVLADGWHMSTHVLAFLITAWRTISHERKRNARFSFGTGKVGVLGGFTSAIVLSIVPF